MKPVILLEVGQIVRPRIVIFQTRVQHWTHAAECANVGGGMLTSAELCIAEKSATPGRAWVKLEILGRTPAGYLKVTGEELAGCFDLVD